MKRFLALVLTLTLALGLCAFSGMASANGEKVHFTATFLQQVWHGDPNDMEILKTLADNANVEVEWQVYANSTWGEKKQLILASGDLPDVFYMNALSATDVVQYSNQGALVDLTDLIPEYCPRLSAIFEEMPNYKAVCVDQDSGRIFKVARAAERGIHYTGALDYINTDWLAKFDLEMPTTIEEYEHALRVMVDGDANGNGQKDEIGYSFFGNLEHCDEPYSYANFFGAFGLVFDTSYVIKDEEGSLVFIANREEYKNALSWLHHMVEEGLFDVEGMTAADQSNLNAKGSAEPPVLCSFSAFSQTFAIPEDRYDSYGVLGQLAGPEGERHNIYRASTNGNINGTQFVMTQAAAGKEAAIMNWLDCHFEPEMSIQLFLGPIGVTLERTESGMIDYVPTPEGTTYSEFRYAVCPVHVPCIIRGTDWGKTVQFMPEDAYKVPIAEEYYRPYADQSNLYENWTSAETDYLANEGLDLRSYCNQMHAKWIVEGGIDEEWDAYCDRLEKLGWEKYLATYQGMYDRTIG